MYELKKAVEDVNKAIDKRPKDKFYKEHKSLLENTIKNHITERIMFINRIVEKA